MSLATRELAPAQEFYSTVLGWTFRPDESLGEEFSVAMADGETVAGVAAVTPTIGVAVAWTPYFYVDGADPVAARIWERGATMAIGPMRLGNGRVALAADPAGATFGFWQGQVRHGWRAEDSPPPAQLELRTRDAFAAAIFYGEVFEWAANRPDHCDVDYQHGAVVVRVGQHTVATLRGGGVESAPDPKIRPRWHVCFTVDDVEAAVRAAVKAGGTVTEEPSNGLGGRSAGLRDPDGGLFTVATPLE
ncbi:VOC family protein [Streptomyces gossypii]|uniref:VOC family protein n=1 Tax=Streptomyces gossypii TaxID=2883101 RepID=UPI0021A36676|nr:VOC family protein [Streptomyces gossypii]